MPPRIKIFLSIAIALAAVGGFIFMGRLGQPGPQGAVVFLGPFMIGSLWIFPEVMRRQGDGKKPQ
jgi:hypothetical protein